MRPRMTRPSLACSDAVLVSRARSANSHQPVHANEAHMPFTVSVGRSIAVVTRLLAIGDTAQCAAAHARAALTRSGTKGRYSPVVGALAR